MALTKVGKEGITGIDNSSDATAITIDSSENVGIGETSLLGKLHVKSGDSGASSVSGNANELVVENSDYTGITILGENEASIMFGDNEDPDVGRIVYFHGTNTMSFMTNANNRMHIDSIGAVTKPHQPAFSVKNTNDQTNIAIDSSVTIVFDSERFDNNSDFASNTFTAPVTGKYHLNVHLYFQNVDDAHRYVQVKLDTSNASYQAVNDPDHGQDVVYYTVVISQLADMDANDTASVTVRLQDGAATTDLANASYFSGHLVC